MKKYARILSLLLALMMILCLFVSCSGDGDDDKSSQTFGKDTISAGGDDDPTDDDTLGEYDFKGADFVILARESTIYEYSVEYSAQSSIVEKAVYERNIKVGERFGVNIVVEPVAGEHENRAKFTTTMSANMNESVSQWHMVSAHGTVISPQVFNGYCYDLKTLPEFDYTKAWWSEEYYEECNFGGKFFFAVGDIAYSMYEQLEVIFVNETLYTANHIGENGNIDALYDLIRDGKWTWETFKKYVSDFTAENVGGEDATYGLALNLHSFRALHKGFDVEFTYRDTDNKVNFYQTLPERTVNVYDAMQTLLIDNQNVLCNKTFSHEAETQNKMFERGDLLFYGQMLGQATQLREMSDVKGVLPYPKFDDLQEDYYTTGANSVSAIMVPRNIAPESAEMVGVVVEALSMYGYHEVTPKYYEDTLTYQVIGTQNGMDMLKIIRDSYTMDFALAYTMAFGDDHAYTAFYKAFFDGTGLLSSTWKGYYAGLKGTLTGLYAVVNNQYK